MAETTTDRSSGVRVFTPAAEGYPRSLSGRRCRGRRGRHVAATPTKPASTGCLQWTAPARSWLVSTRSLLPGRRFLVRHEPVRSTATRYSFQCGGVRLADTRPRSGRTPDTSASHFAGMRVARELPGTGVCVFPSTHVLPCSLPFSSEPPPEHASMRRFRPVRRSLAWSPHGIRSRAAIHTASSSSSRTKTAPRSRRLPRATSAASP